MPTTPPQDERRLSPRIHAIRSAPAWRVAQAEAVALVGLIWASRPNEDERRQTLAW